MPNPALYKNTKKDHARYMSDCMHQTTHVEKKDRAQGIAMCMSMWQKEHGKKKPGKAKNREAAQRVASVFVNSIGMK